jgi:hypothetical protein
MMAGVILSCGMCAFQCVGMESFVQHAVRFHRNDPNFAVTCKFVGCGVSYNNWSSFKSHFYRKHAGEEPLILQGEPAAVPQFQDEANMNEGNLAEDNNIMDSKFKAPIPTSS